MSGYWPEANGHLHDLGSVWTYAYTIVCARFHEKDSIVAREPRANQPFALHLVSATAVLAIACYSTVSIRETIAHKTQFAYNRG